MPNGNINFRKLRLIAKGICAQSCTLLIQHLVFHDILRYQTSKYDFEPVQALQNYFQNLWVEPESRRFQMSYECEPREKRTVRCRQRALRVDNFQAVQQESNRPSSQESDTTEIVLGTKAQVMQPAPRSSFTQGQKILGLRHSNSNSPNRSIPSRSLQKQNSDILSSKYAVPERVRSLSSLTIAQIQHNSLSKEGDSPTQPCSPKMHATGSYDSLPPHIPQRPNGCARVGSSSPRSESQCKASRVLGISPENSRQHTLRKSKVEQLLGAEVANAHDSRTKAKKASKKGFFGRGKS